MEVVNLTSGTIDKLARRLGEVIQFKTANYAMAGSNLANFATQAFYGTNYDPSIHKTIGTATNLLASSVFGQALGMDNPRVTEMANRRLSDYYFGATQGHYIQNMALIGNAMAKYNRYNTEINKGNPFQLTQTESSAAMYHLRSFFTKDDWTALNAATTQQEISDTQIAKITDKASKVITTAKKILNMGDNIAEIFNTAQIIGGTADIDTNFNKFLNLSANLVDAGLNTEERQAAIQNTVEMNMAYRRRGFGAAAASMIANRTTGMMIVASKLQRSGVNVDATELANNASEQAAIYMDAQSRDLQLALLTGDTIEDKNKRDAYFKAVTAAGNNPAALMGIVGSYGLTSNFKDFRIRFAQDTKGMFKSMSTEAQAAYESVANKDLIQKEIDTVEDVLKNKVGPDAAKARAIYSDITSGRRDIESLTEAESRTLRRAGIFQNTSRIAALKEDAKKKASIDSLARAIGTESTDILLGGSAEAFTSRLTAVSDKTKFNDITGQNEHYLEGLTEEEAKAKFIASQKEILKGTDTAEINATWEQLMKSSKDGMAITLADGSALVRDAKGNFMTASKDEVERATKKGVDMVGAQGLVEQIIKAIVDLGKMITSENMQTPTTTGNQ